MRFCALVACLVLGISVQDGWSLPLKSTFVTFPGDILKNMTDSELAEVSSRWLIFCLDTVKQHAVKLCREKLPDKRYLIMLMKRFFFKL